MQDASVVGVLAGIPILIAIQAVHVVADAATGEEAGLRFGLAVEVRTVEGVALIARAGCGRMRYVRGHGGW